MAGVVVDTLGLQLQSYDPEFSTGQLSPGHVDPRPPAIRALAFRDNDVTPAGRSARHAPYGQVMNLGVVQSLLSAVAARREMTTLYSPTGAMSSMGCSPDFW